MTTASLDVTTAAQRDLVNRGWPPRRTGEGCVSAETYCPDRLVAGDPFQNLMYTNATVSNVEYANVTDKTGFALEVKIGVAFGVDFNLETTDSEAEDATYLGRARRRRRPGAGRLPGVRSAVSSMTMSSTPPRMPAYGDRPPADAETMPWSRVLVRMVLVVLPEPADRQLHRRDHGRRARRPGAARHPSLTLLMPAMAGLLAGIGLGVVFAPGRTRLAGHALLALVITLAAYLLIFGLSLLRASGPLPSASLAAYLAGPLIVLALQSVVAVVIWMIKASRTA